MYVVKNNGKASQSGCEVTRSLAFSLEQIGDLREASKTPIEFNP